jgi:diguanylate cyclase (GGDEF)-like protein
VRPQIKTQHRNGDGPGSVDDPQDEVRRAISDAQRALTADHTAADADQSAADTDQTLSDADQTASASDQTIADIEQRAADRDQETADRDRAAGSLTAADVTAYDTSRDERETVSFERLGTRLVRASTARQRDETARHRDRTAEARDEAGRARDARAADLLRDSAGLDVSLVEQLQQLAAQAGADRARAAADRERAARDRATAAHERERLEAELRSAHLDELTGAFRREMGRLALSNEIDRAWRDDGRFVVAFVDVDGLKALNDRDGHAAGDAVLRTVVRVIRARLRSFDPVIRYGGDEFVCGLGGSDIAEARRRFDSIGVALEDEAGVGLSVGFATLTEGDTADQLTERADAAMLEVKATRHSRQAAGKVEHR